MNKINRPALLMTCKYCSSSFSNQNELIRHRSSCLNGWVNLTYMLHDLNLCDIFRHKAPPTEYKCELCNALFYYKDDHRHHMRRKHLIINKRIKKLKKKKLNILKN